MADKRSTVSCPECGKMYEVSNVSPGQKARCKCGCKFDVASGQIVDESGSTAPLARTASGTSGTIAAVESLAEARDTILAEVGKAIVGQKEVLDQILTAFFARGHCVLMGVPGLAKTMMVYSLSQTMLLDFKRIQFTPDLMPTDITGTNILQRDPKTRQRRFVFHKGPIFTNVLLADEINRTPPKTQAALLEAMQERTVTESGRTHMLPEPFLVLATQNPLELEGTYPLPEAQLDRFILLIKVDYPNLPEEQQILLSTTGRDGEVLDGILDAKSVTRYQDLVRQVPVSEYVAKYAARLCRATRPQRDEAPEFVNKFVRYGCGPRAGQSLILAAKAHVVLNGRFNVSCDDIREYALPVLRHRMILNFAAASEGLDTDAVIKKLLDAVGESE
ncbi:MAG: AAA family ATPase [Planctomycetota bacterium]